jgi:hypothetical protein
VVDELPRLMAGTWSDHGRDDVQDVNDLDWSVCIRSDPLMTAHQQMARADLSSPEDVARVLGDLEAQLSELTRRQDAVEGRLQQVRKAILGQYRAGAVTPPDWLG